MVDKLSLLKIALENILSEDQVEAAYTLRTLADELEEYGCPDREDVLSILSTLVEEEDV